MKKILLILILIAAMLVPSAFAYGIDHIGGYYSYGQSYGGYGGSYGGYGGGWGGCTFCGNVRSPVMGQVGGCSGWNPPSVRPWTSNPYSSSSQSYGNYRSWR